MYIYSPSSFFNKVGEMLMSESTNQKEEEEEEEIIDSFV